MLKFIMTNLINARNLFIAHLIMTSYMLGGIWIIQIIHYPLFSLVGKENFINYELQHIQKTSFVIALPMLFELISFGGLLYFSNSFRQSKFFWVSGFLIVIIWLVTFIVSVPQHNILSLGYNQKAIDLLVKSNWIRTICWSLRVILLIPLI